MEDLSREELLEMVKLQKQRIECLEKLVLDLNKKIIDLIETN